MEFFYVDSKAESMSKSNWNPLKLKLNIFWYGFKIRHVASNKVSPQIAMAHFAMDFSNMKICRVNIPFG